MNRCADFLDSASELVDTERDSLVSAISEAAKNGVGRLEPKGRCYYCDESIPNPKVFCDSNCADDHAALLASRARNGRR